MVQRVLRAILLLLVLGRSSSVLAYAAQATQDGRLIVTVVDTSGAIVPGAKVTVTALDGGDRAPTFAPVSTSDKGVATVEGLLPGRFRIQAEFPGFEIG